MKTAQKIIFVLDDDNGFGSAISNAIQPYHESPIRRLDDNFDISLEDYGIRDSRAKFRISHFVDDEGTYQVSLLLMSTCKPPLLMCALNAFIYSLYGGAKQPFGIPTIVAPFIISASEYKPCVRNPLDGFSRDLIHGIQLGSPTRSTDVITSKIQSPEPSVQIYNETLACFLLLARAWKAPLVALIGRIDNRTSGKTLEEHKMICEMGELLTDFSCLQFSRERAHPEKKKKMREMKEPWQAFYG